MKFNSKKDFLHVFMTIICIAILWIPAFLLYDIVGWFYYSVCSIVSLIFILFLFFVSYEITEKSLISKFLFIKFEVELDRIKVVKKTKNLYLSYATSFDRLEIRFGFIKNNAFSKFFVSPKNQEKFLKLLEEKCENVKFYDYNESPDPKKEKLKK